ncbi:MAG: DUF5666 domain-containing protein [Rhodospirillaceae bacterium]|nr:DUF5666 domain-containing protein [Rhodospirillaceae bacterium]
MRTEKFALRRTVAATLALTLIAGCAATPPNQRSAALYDDGISGTGIVAQNTSDDGISGTGIVASYDGGDGIGGTGVVTQAGGDGIGGTGIIGTISGFGSIIVNGLKLEYNNKTAVESDGRPATLSDLKIGQVIEGVARRDARGDLRLEQLEIRHAVTGPISSIDHDNERLVVLGQTVRVNLAGDKSQKTAFVALNVGDLVRVSGLRMDDGMIVASRLDQTDDDGRVLVRGPVTTADNNAVTIGGLTVNLSSAALAEPLEAGNRAFVAGRMLADTFSADVVVARPGLPFDERVTEVYLEGYVPSDATVSLSIQGAPVTGLGLQEDIKPGDRVVVTGRVGVDGVIAAREINHVRTVITVLRPSRMVRPARIRPTTIQRPERMERQRPVERPTVPERPQRERPGDFRPPMV